MDASAAARGSPPEDGLRSADGSRHSSWAPSLEPPDLADPLQDTSPVRGAPPGDGDPALDPVRPPVPHQEPPRGTRYDHQAGPGR